MIATFGGLVGRFPASAGRLPTYGSMFGSHKAVMPSISVCPAQFKLHVGLVHLSQFHQPGFFDQAPLYTRESDVGFLKDNDRGLTLRRPSIYGCAGVSTTVPFTHQGHGIRLSPSIPARARVRQRGQAGVEPIAGPRLKTRASLNHPFFARNVRAGEMERRYKGEVADDANANAYRRTCFCGNGRPAWTASSRSLAISTSWALTAKRCPRTPRVS